MERLTQTSDKGGVAFTFDLEVTCQPSEMKKILKLAEKLKEYEDLGTVEELQQALEMQINIREKIEAWCWKHEQYNQDDLNELMDIVKTVE